MKLKSLATRTIRSSKTRSFNVRSRAVNSIVQSLEKRMMMSATLADWTFETSVPATAGPFAAEVGSGSASGYHVGASTYSSPAGNGSLHSFSSTNWNSSGTLSTSDYYQFNTSTASSTGISIQFDQTSSNTGPGSFQLEYSTDGVNYTAFGSPYTVFPNAANTSNGTSAAWSTTTAATGYTYTNDLSSISALNGQANISIRLVDASTTSAAGGTTATGGTDRIDNVIIAAQTTAPQVTSLSPAGGSTSGGNTVTINGLGFTGATAVKFGTAAATNISVVNDGQITVTAPSGSVGSVDVTVTTPVSTSVTSTKDKYTYTVAPSVSSVTPSGGPLAGGTVVTILGSGFAAGDTVAFGSVAGTGVVVNSATSITATSPAESASVVDVTVTGTGLTSSTSSADHFTYAAVPTVTALNSNYSGGGIENSGIDSGGDVVVISGANLSTTTNVSFGTVAATSFSYNAATGNILAVSPAQAAGTVADITVTNPGGTSATSAADQFTYTLTTILGTESLNLVANAIVTIDSSPVISLVLAVAGDTFNAGAATYSYTSFYIQDSTGEEDVFGAHAVNGVSSLPNGYVPQVGNTVTLTGTVSPYEATPEIGTVTNIATNGTATVPALPTVTIPQLTYNVSLGGFNTSIGGYILNLKGVYISPTFSPTATSFSTTNLTGTVTDAAGNALELYYTTTYNEAVLVNLYYAGLYQTSIPTSNLVDITGYVDYFNGAVQFNPVSITNPSTVAPILNSELPAQGPIGGTNTVTISGAGLTGSTSVSFGGTPGTNVTVVNDHTLTVTAPAHAVATVNLTVTNQNGVSNALQYAFTNAPVVSGVSPGGETIAGGQPVVITGSGFTGVTSVQFGSTVLTTGFTVNSPTQITVAAAPAHSAAVVDITVTSNVVSSTSTADQFIYDDIPTVSLSPTSGADNGGTAVVITGSSLFGVSAVKFGTLSATSFTYNATTGAITAIAPAQAKGTTVDVTVTNYAGSSAIVSTDKFTYTATTISVAQLLAPATTVTIDDNAVITAILSQPATVNGITYPYWSFLIQDSTGSMDVFQKSTGTGTLIGGFVPVVGNTISITGLTSPFRQIPELGTITAISNTGTAAVPAISKYTVSQLGATTLPLGAGYGGRLVEVDNITVGGLTGNFGGTNATGTANDGTGQMTLYYYPTSYATANETFFGMAPPTTTVSLVGFIQEFTSGTTNTPEFTPLFIVPKPTWLAQNSQAIWNPALSTLYVNGASTIIADPGTDNPIVDAINTIGAPDVLNIATPTSGHQVHISGLDLTNGASVVMNTSAGTPTILVDSNGNGFTIDATSKLDITNNFVDFKSGSISAVTTLIASAYSNGLWTGFGITSSTAAASAAASTFLTAVGAIPNTTATGSQLYSTFDGASVTSTDVLVRYTYYGDADLSGKIDGSDYSRIDSTFTSEVSSGSSISGWYNGDFNYDGTVDGSDYTLIDNVFNMQGSPLATPTAMIATITGASSTVQLANGSKHTSFAGTTIPVAAALPAQNTFADKKVKTSLIDQVLGDLVTSA